MFKDLLRFYRARLAIHVFFVCLFWESDGAAKCVGEIEEGGTRVNRADCSGEMGESEAKQMFFEPIMGPFLPLLFPRPL